MNSFAFKTMKKLLNNLGLQSSGFPSSLHTHIDMYRHYRSNSINVIYGIKDIHDMFEAYDIRHISCIDMLIWVSKEAQEFKDCSPMPFYDILIRSMAR